MTLKFCGWEMKGKHRLFLRIVILCSVVAIVVGATFRILYTAAFEQQHSRLAEVAQSQTRLVEAIAKYDLPPILRNRGAEIADDG